MLRAWEPGRSLGATRGAAGTKSRPGLCWPACSPQRHVPKAPSTSIPGPRPTATRSTSCWRSAASPTGAHPVNIGKGDQFEPDFLAISPNNKIPAIVDPDGPDGQPISLFESGAILVYLAGKTGRFLPTGDRARYEVLQWLMFQMGGVGPMLGQAHHFRIYAPEKIGYAIDRYTNEAKRLYGVIDKQPVAASTYIAGAGLFDRRHRHLPVAAQLGEPGHRADRVPAPEALVRRHRRAARRAARRQGAGRPAQPLTGDKERDILFGSIAVSATLSDRAAGQRPESRVRIEGLSGCSAAW